MDPKRRNVNVASARTWRERPWDFQWDFWRASWDFDAFSFPSMPFRLLGREAIAPMISVAWMASRRGLEPLTPGLGSAISGC
jgi:hypothetical protein